MDYPYRSTDYNNPYMDYRRHRTDSKQDDPKRSDRWIDDSHRSDQWLDDHPFDRRLADPYLDSGRGFAMGKYNDSFAPTTQRLETYGRPELPSHQNGFYLNEKKVRPETRDANHGSNVYNEPYSAGKTEKKEKKKKGKFSKICLNFADITSLNGLPFISSSKNPVVKVVWTLLLMAALGAMIFHLYSLFSDFFEYKKHSKINLSFNNLPFPAVTICNVNMMRQSKINLSSGEVQQLIMDADPQKRMALVKKCNETTGDEDDPGECLEYDPDNTDEEDPEETLYDMQYQGTWEAEGTKSKMYETEQKFREAFNRQPVDIRKQLGHQATDMILQCSYAGKKCEARNFTLAFSETYGNCHTLQYDKFLSRASGPAGGLELTIFLETHEYIPGISNGMGIQLLVHDQETVPFPDEEGIAISPGTNTFVGIKQVSDTMNEVGIKQVSDTMNEVGIKQVSDMMNEVGIKQVSDEMNEVGIKQVSDKMNEVGIKQVSDKMNEVGIKQVSDTMNEVGIKQVSDTINEVGIKQVSDTMNEVGIKQVSDTMNEVGIKQVSDTINEVGIKQVSDTMNEVGIKQVSDTINEVGINR
ncbi:degenerin mec-4-like [Physella acuta]|uniref:degenerin mec-4-like n=1 Tax=Physella acuta TaxID=109671 RepID=UPI0027DB6325|nr:degenerin mec-4-like [Physella acuta]